MPKLVTNHIRSSLSRWSTDGPMLRCDRETTSSDIRHREGWSRSWNSSTLSNRCSWTGVILSTFASLSVNFAKDLLLEDWGPSVAMLPQDDKCEINGACARDGAPASHTRGAPY